MFTFRLLTVSCLTLFICMISNSSFAYDLYHSNAYPYMAHDSIHKGFLAELVIKAGQKEGLEITPVYMPWKRAQMLAEQGKNDLIIAVRTPRRENKFTWISPLFTMKTVIATINVKINTLQEAAEKLNHITVMQGIALHNDILSQGFPPNKVLNLPIDRRLVHFLQGREKTGWIAQKMQIKSFWSSHNIEAPVVIGDVITERKLWLACSRNCSKIPIENMTSTIEKLRQSSWYINRENAYIKPN